MLDRDMLTSPKPSKRPIRILHSAALLRPSSGMLTQMEWEQEAADDLGLLWAVKMYCPSDTRGDWSILHRDPAVVTGTPDSTLKKLRAWLRLRFRYHRWLLAQQDSIDIFLLRYYVHDPFQMWFVQECSKPVYFVHHTLEVPELRLPGTPTARLRAQLERIVGKRCLSAATGIIGVTDEIVRYEKSRTNRDTMRSFVYPNGIHITKTPVNDTRSASVPEFLFVANFSPWHGLDILLQEVSQSEQRFLLHLVGRIPNALQPYTHDPRIQVHGELVHDEILKLSEQCWIGLASFALKRKEMQQACPLKVREYLMLGLPVYGDYTDCFPPGSAFFRKGSTRIDEVIEFAHETRHLRKDEVLSMARAWIDKKLLVSELHDALRTEHGVP